MPTWTATPARQGQLSVGLCTVLASDGAVAPWRMFQQSHAALKKGGELWVIGNRHLNHHIKLKRIFSHCKTVTSSRRFVVLRATKQ